MKKNDTIFVTITGVSSEGNGIGRHDGMAVFIPGTACGDEVEALVVKVCKSYAHGKLVRVLKPSPDRVESDCPVFLKCGGCVYRHISYEAECRLKAQRVQETIRRIGGLDIPQRPILSGPQQSGYRNKALYPVGLDQNGKLAIGFYAPRSHRIVDCRQCSLQPPEFSSLVNAVAHWMTLTGVSPYRQESNEGLVRHIYLRKAFGTGQIMACLVVNGKRVPDEPMLVKLLREAGEPNGLKSIILNQNTRPDNVILGSRCRTLWGQDTIEDTLCDLQFSLSPLSFYQVNREAAQILYRRAAQYAQPEGALVLDLYCGAGTIGLTMAQKAEKVIGVEIVPDAIRDADKNAALNGIQNAEFLCGDAAQAAEMLVQRGLHPDVVVLDPPRKGCSPELLTILADRFCPDRIVYVSCDPATLARDLKILNSSGYLPQEVTPVDMFPRTSHVETVVLLSKGEVDSKKIRVEFSLEDMDMSEFQDGATYPQIKDYVLEHSGLKVSNLYISQIKRKCGIEVGKNYNLPKSDDSRQPQCPPEKEKAIREAFKYFGMI
ncbi:23S rRNA (uracil(1939)-C(5))-methyltransferase RlmD [[Clostridium] leptum]|nr:23S rRNA (uracil(1939)-C(5))-methyltransferase RlmD [[Clostridium] leptum]